MPIFTGRRIIVQMALTNYSIDPDEGPETAMDAHKVVGGLLLFTLSMEALPIPITASALPATTIIGVALAPIFFSLWHPKIHFTALGRTILLFASYLLLISILGLAIDMQGGTESARAIAAIRQFVALVAGVTLFLVARTSLRHISDEVIIKCVLIGALPSMVVALLTGLGVFVGIDMADVVAEMIRTAFGLRVHNRAAGLMLEPSHYGYFISVAILPMIIAGYKSHINRRFLRMFGMLAVVTFVMAGSVTAGVVLGSLIVGSVIWGPNRKMAGFAAVGLGLAVVVFVLTVPGSYPVRQLMNLISGRWSLSITTRFYSTVGPITAFFSDPRAIIGYGLGATATHLFDIVPQTEAAQDIQSVTYATMPNLKSMLGRVLGEGGLLGGFLFVLVFRTALNQCRMSHKELKISCPLLSVSPMVLMALGAGAAVSFGSFALPFLWFWLAIIDSRYNPTNRDQLITHN